MNKLWIIQPGLFSILMMLFVLIIIGLMFFVLLNEKRSEGPGSQYIKVAGMIEKDNRTKNPFLAELEEAIVTLPIIKELVKAVTENEAKQFLDTEEKFNLVAKRYGSKLNYREVNKRRKANLMKYFAVSMVVLMATSFIPSKNLVFFVFLLLMTGAFIVMYYWQIKFKFKRYFWKLGVLEDLSIIISYYMYSTTQRSIPQVIIDCMGDMSALRVDIEMLQSDFSSFTQAEALDRFAKRINLPEVNNFVSYVKATMVMDREATKVMLSSYNSSLNKTMETTMNRAIQIKFTIVLTAIIIITIATVMTMVVEKMPELIEIQQDNFL